jgi:hypothetical protein
MRFLNNPTIDLNNNSEQFFFDSVNNILGVTGQVGLYKSETESVRTLLKSSSALTNEYTLTLPPNSGSSGQVLTTDGTGTLTFTDPDLGGNRIFVSAKNGNDINDGFIKPVATIKRAAQIAASFSTPTYAPGTNATNAQTILRANKNFIASEVIGYIARQVSQNLAPFVSFTYTISRCYRDIGYMVEAVIYDLMYGGNTQSRYAGSSYSTSTVVINSQKTQSLAAINYAKYVAAAVLSNTALTSNGTYTEAPYQRFRTDSPPITYTQTIDVSKPTVTSNITGGTIQSTATSTTITGISDVSNLCKNMTLTKVSGTGAFGTSAVITNVNYVTKVVSILVTTNNTAGTIVFTASAAGAVSNSFDIIANILNNGISWRDSNITQVNPLYTPLPVTIQIAAGDYTEDNPIIMPDKTTLVGDDLRSVVVRPLNSGKDIFRVRTGMYMTGFTFRDQIVTDITSASYGRPKHTWNYAIAFDDVNDYTIDRGLYIGLSASLPIVNLSPYIQNCSIISFLGGNGALVDGSKVATLNVPLVQDEVEFPPVGPAPTQGKSMVANAFTMISFGGTGWKVINEAYVQLVSCFQIFLLNGVWCQSGGYASITNSATNFGVNALRSSGFSQNIFSFDKAIIASIGEDASNLQTITSLGHGRIPVNHYVLKFKSSDGNYTDLTSTYKSTSQKSISFLAGGTLATTGIIDNTAFTITFNGHGFTEGLSVYYVNPSPATVSDVPGLTNGDSYYVHFIDANTFSLYFDGSLIRQVQIQKGTGSHTLQQNSDEFFINEITDYHKQYQTLTLAAGTYNFTPGSVIAGTVGLNIISAYVYSWNSGTRQLVVSIAASTNGGSTQRTPFDYTISPCKINADHTSPTAVTNITVTNHVDRVDLFTGTYTVKSVYGSRIGGSNSPSSLPGKYVWLYKPSVVNSSGHTWEYAGAGIDYNALPDNGGKTIIAQQQVEEVPGRVYTSGTNELGDFTVGNFITAYNRTGNIVFSNKVTVSELSALKLSLSDVSITSISTDVGLGDNEAGGALDSRLTTQRAQRIFLANRLGDFIDRHVSTSSVPAAIVQLNGNGQINADLIPATRTISTHLVTTYNGRLTLYEKIPVDEVSGGDVVSESYAVIELTLNNPVTITAGSIVTQASSNAYGTVRVDTTTSTSLKLAAVVGIFNTSNNLTNTTTSTSLSAIPSIVGSAVTVSDSYYLTKDNTSQFLQLDTTKNYRFTIGSTISAVISGGVATISDFRSGYITNLNSLSLTPGSGYNTAGTYYNKALTGGTGKYTSVAGATSSGTIITVTSTTNLEIGMKITVTAGVGAFAAGTTVTAISSSTQFTVSTTLTTPLSGGATVVRGDAIGAYADITVNASGVVTSVSLYRGGVGYQVGDILSVADSDIGGRTGGAAFTIPVSIIEKRLYIDITNGLKFIASSLSNNYIEDNNTSSFTLTLNATTAKTFNTDSTDNSGNVNYATNRITITGHTFASGDPVNYTIAAGGVAPTGLTAGKSYFVKSIDANTIELYADYALSSKKDFGTNGTGTSTLTRSGLDVASDTFYKTNHGLTSGTPIKISSFSVTAPQATIGGVTAYITSGSFWFVGSVTTNTFTLHQYKVDAASSISGTTNNPLNIISQGSITATFTLENVTIVGQVNTSSRSASNYSSLSTTTIDASAIISGIVSPSRLATGSASSSTYLRGDSTWQSAVASLSQAPNSAISMSGSGLTTPTVTVTAISGTIDTVATGAPFTAKITLSAGSTSQLFVGMTLTKTSGLGAFGGTTTIISIDTNLIVTILNTTIASAGSLVFSASAVVNQYTGNPTIDVNKVVSGKVTGDYTNIGVASFDTNFFTLGSKSTSGQVTITPKTIDALKLNGQIDTYYLNSGNHNTQPVNLGGTGLQNYVTGDILYATGATTLATLAVTSKAGYVLTVNAGATAPVYSPSTGTLGNVVFSTSPTLSTSIVAGTVSFDLINTTATTVNFAGAATTLSIGASTGTTTINTPLIANGSSVTGTVTTTGITSTPAIAIDSWDITVYRSAKYIIQVTCTAVSAGSNLNTYQVSEVLVIQNGSTATMTEYGAIKTTNDLATFTVDINSGNCRLLAVAANATDTITVKLHKTILKV